ncbi:MAG: hypothetical protein MPW15_17580 [Candidatus Manganitrophus sp.]|nr:hypothetical protein [Candidatus Manganitrophus sp.]
MQLAFGLFERDPFQLRKLLRDQLFPEVIVEMFIEERSVHIEQDEIDLFPLDHPEGLITL